MLRIITILFFVSIFSSHAQVQINGHVQDEYGQPIIGVNIIEKDTSNGTLTDFYGNYTLEVSKNSTLIFSYVGYASKEVLVDSQSEINVTLVEGE